jgi:hypothetical protein
MVKTKWRPNYGGHLAFTDRKPDKKSVRKMTVRKLEGSVFGGLLYLLYSQHLKTGRSGFSNGHFPFTF